MLHGAFARQHAAPVVNEFAAQRALVQPPRHAVAENPMRMHFCNASSFTSRGFVSRPSLFGDAEELFEQRPDLPRGDGVDAELAAGVEAELVFAPHNSTRA